MNVWKSLDMRWLLALGFSVQLLTCIYSIGFHHFDEHFQILEFAYQKLGYRSEPGLAWEFGARIRPAIPVAFAAAILKVLGEPSPFLWTFCLRLVAAAVGLGASLALWRAWKEPPPSTEASRFPPTFAHSAFLLSLFLWCLPYMNARYSSEGLAGSFLALGCAFLFAKRRIAWLAGFCFGMAFVQRFQVGLMLAGLAGWMLWHMRPLWRTVLMMGLGFLSILLLEVAAERWLYDTWTFAPLRYFTVNILENKVASFGISPWWYLLEQLAMALPPLSILCLSGLFLWTWRFPAHPLTWMAWPFLLTHQLIGHKEFRFLFPLVHFLPFVLAFHLSQLPKWLVRLSWAVNLVGLVFLALRPATSTVAFYRNLHQIFPGPLKLFTIQSNPFELVKLPVEVYRQPQWEVHKQPDVRSLPQTGKFHVFFQRSWTPETMAQMTELGCPTVFSNFPSWARSLSLERWLSKNQGWSIVECNR